MENNTRIQIMKIGSTGGEKIHVDEEIEVKRRKEVSPGVQGFPYKISLEL